MSRELGLGPVFAYEWAASSRRWQVYGLRAAFVLFLLAAMTLIWWNQPNTGALPGSIRAQAAVGERYFYGIIGTQLALVMMVAPAFTAGSICADRQRGILAHMLLTDLSDGEIVLGKLAARLAPVFGLVACALPVLSLGTLLGGIDPVALSLAFLVVLAVAAVGCALALALSVWAMKTQEVLMATYALTILYLLAYPVWLSLAMGTAWAYGPPEWLLRANPFWLSFAPYAAPNQVEAFDFVAFLGGSAMLSIGLVALSVLRMRAVSLRQAGRSQRPAKRERGLSVWARLARVLPGPTLDGNPVLWREWHRARPSRWSLVLWVGFLVGFSIAGVYSIVEVLREGIGLNAPNPGAPFAILEVVFGLLLLSVASSTSMAEERVRGSLDVLMATPLPSRSILWGKWWATFRLVLLLAIWPTLIGAAMGIAHRRPIPAGWPANYAEMKAGPAAKAYCVALIGLNLLAHGALITSMGLALATWLRRQAHAVALGVLMYAALAIGWPILAEVMLPRTRYAVEAAMTLSPIVADGLLFNLFSLYSPDTEWLLAWVTLWTILVTVVSFGVLLATWLTFDRCMGRVSDWTEEFGPLNRFLPLVPPPVPDFYEPTRAPEPATVAEG